ncbi:Molybdopterin oxidoreductase Fe4S4 region [Candidatus Methylomirabilis lanthanidiphila]|uniref:Molybdopterin oxidoreductase Fe4S4 region n=1 Tax=Candidatus Methylomirabilis lanthanidiphila TaxID=2211376 RepID=A0A564ZLD2_9BACT|nr:molybdopterin-dependent oxidoreductase [Candidatus Methylomirabilis lanthanidiphila]VUZ86135.1 Molybdopterin oxidoreductase Fe4S4 region [Candidatus Methylomirabilis lanthanidiphila]
MVELIVDSKPVQVPAGTSILEAVLQTGSEIPHFCYHPKLRVVGSCRMCQVEVQGTPKLVISCATPVADGMEVLTASDRVKKARNAVLEFLLLNHPLDCPVCDKGGECPLQNYTLRYGPGESRFIEPKIQRIKHQPIGPFIIFDAERCILCTRCVRFCQDVTGTSELGVFGRGDRSEIGLFPGRSLDNRYSGNVIDLCPVGALTSRDYRFAARPWDLITQVPTICGLCSAGCNITADVRHKESGAQILRIRPRVNNEVNGHWICDEGRFEFHFAQDPGRIGTPFMQRHGELQPASWDEAIDRIAEDLSRILGEKGAEAIGVIASARLTNEEAFLVRQLFGERLGIPNIDYRVARSQEPGGDAPEDHLLRRTDKYPNSVGMRTLGLLPKSQGMGTREMLSAAGEGRLAALLVFEEDLVAALSGELPVANSLKKLDLLVTHDLFLTATAKLAHVVLPGLSFFEKEGTFTNFAGRVQRLQPALEPFGRAIPLVEFLQRLANRMELPLTEGNAEAVWQELARSVSACAGVTYESIGELGTPLVETAAAQ